MTQRVDFTRELPRLLSRLWRFSLRLTGDGSQAEVLAGRALEECGTCTEYFSSCHNRALLAALSVICSLWERNRTLPGGKADKVAKNDPGKVWCLQLRSEGCFGQRYGDAFRLCELPDDERVVMLLVEVEGLTYAEAADVLFVTQDIIIRRIIDARTAIGKSVLADQI